MDDGTRSCATWRWSSEERSEVPSSHPAEYLPRHLIFSASTATRLNEIVSRKLLVISYSPVIYHTVYTRRSVDHTLSCYSHIHTRNALEQDKVTSIGP